MWDANVSEETAEAFCARVETMPGGPFSCKESQVTIAGLTKFVLVIESLIESTSYNVKQRSCGFEDFAH